MQTVSSFKYRPPSQTDQPKTQQGGWEDILPGAGGLIGSLFQPEGLLPGAATSGAGGAIGETARQGIRAATGRGFDTGQIARSTGEQAAYGAIPGGQELRRIPMAGKLAENIFGRTALRAATGALGGAAAQQVSNFGGQGQNPLTTGGMVGAINAISPIAGKTLGLVPGAAKFFGGTAVKSAGNIIEKGKQPEFSAIQRLFGKQAISTGGQKEFINPAVENVITKYNLPIPTRGGNISEFEPALTKASQAVEAKLQPILKDPIYSIKVGDVQNIITKNKGTFFGADRKAQQSFPIEVQKLFNKRENTKITLSDLKEVQRELGKVAGYGRANPTPLQDFAQQTYRDLGTIIDKNLASVDKTEYKGLLNEHKILSRARDAYQQEMKGKGVLDPSLTNKGIATEKAQGGLSGERLRQLGVGSAVTLAGLANLVPGSPDWLKALADLGVVGAAGYETAQFGPHLNPEKALQIGGNLAKTPQVGQKFQRALQQLGVRLPSLQ